MQIARVLGPLVSTVKHEKLHAAKLLLVQPLSPWREAEGAPLLAVDAVGAGVGETVLVVIEGKSAGAAVRRKAAPVDAAIIGIVDRIDMAADAETPATGGSR